MERHFRAGNHRAAGVGDLPAQRRGLRQKNLRKQQRDGQRAEKLQSGTKTRLSSAYFPTTRMENESGSMGARPPRPPPFFWASLGASAGGAGGGPYSAAISRMWSVLLSSVRVLARGMVCRFCSTTKLVGLFSLMTSSVPYAVAV